MPIATPTKVVDASAIVALLFKEPEQGLIAESLSGASLLAPTLLIHEVANVCATKMRRNPDYREDMLAAFAILFSLGIDFAEIDHTGTLELAFDTNLTAYDASYLWLAQNLGAELITLDRQLAAAAQTLR